MPDSTLTPGAKHQIDMIGTIVADGVNPLDPVEAAMIGAQKSNSFELEIYGYDGSFFV